MSKSLLDLLDAYLQMIPAGTLKWAVPSATAEQWRALDAATLARCKAALAPEGAAKRRLTSFHLSDCGAAAPTYAFDLVGMPRGEDFPEAVTLVQMSFPTELVDEDVVEQFVAQVRKMGQMIDFSSGYCAPALLFSTLHIEDAYSNMRGLALRHPGYDVHGNDRSRLRIGQRSRGARWITFLGPALLARLGGQDALQRQLPSPITVEDVGAGVLIRAGTAPEIGDVNRRLEVPLLRAVAKALEPVTWFGEPHLLAYFANYDEALLERWERRLLD
jgi:hypothetical protein